MDHLIILTASYFAQRYIFLFVFGVSKEMTRPALYVYLKLVRKDRVYKEDKIFACSLQAVSQREEEK